jgi:hypothetical protein
VSAGPAEALRISIQRQYTHLQAQGRVAEALYGVAIDLLAPTLDQDLSPLDRGRLLRALDVPVGAAAQQALEALEAELAAFLDEDLPAGVARSNISGRVSSDHVSRIDFE